MKNISMTNQEQVRKSFWESFPEYKPEYRAKKQQNSYNATIRSCFVEYVDSLQKDGQISEKLAYRVTL